MTNSPEDQGHGNVEHERRYLVADQSILKGLEGYEIEQGYLFAQNGWAIRARRIFRLTSDGSEDEVSAFLTAKGPRHGYTRPEYEVALEAEDAAALIASAPHVVRKTRYPKISERETWEIDVFTGANAGLVIAELEASPKALDTLRRPWWAGAEITSDDRYHNENLAARPWPTWSDQ